MRQLSEHTRRWVLGVGKVGLVARGVVFAIIGCGLFKAGWSGTDPEPPSIDGAQFKLSQQPYSALLLGVVAAGLVCYGLHMLVSARYRTLL